MHVDKQTACLRNVLTVMIIRRKIYFVFSYPSTYSILSDIYYSHFHVLCFMKLRSNFTSNSIPGIQFNIKSKPNYFSCGISVMTMLHVSCR